MLGKHKEIESLFRADIFEAYRWLTGIMGCLMRRGNGKFTLRSLRPFHEMISDDESNPGFPMQRLSFIPFMHYLK